VFFRARDPGGLKAWYAEHLGLSVDAPLHEEGPLVWSPFRHDTDYFGPSGQQWMVNYRVDDLDAVLARLREAGAEVDDKVQEESYGRFGWAVDPEGNRFELWEPAGDW
jgi:catechol 2,3-dioxygenase-like lactoylglutathione lyase family enzyme